MSAHVIPVPNSTAGMTGRQPPMTSPPLVAYCLLTRNKCENLV